MRKQNSAPLADYIAKPPVKWGILTDMHGTWCCASQHSTCTVVWLPTQSLLQGGRSFK